MSLSIDSNLVTAVLLADGWHDVLGATFDCDAYEFVDGEQLIHGGGQSDVCATGFSFRSDFNERMAGPLTAVLAVKYGDAAKQ